MNTAKPEVDRLFALSRDLIVVLGFDGYLKRVNPAFQTRLGYTAQEALSRQSIDFVHPDDRERTEHQRVRLRDGEPNVSWENRYACKDGSYRWVEWTGTPVLEDQLIYAVGRDITERWQAEADLRLAAERAVVLAEEQAALRRVATLVARGAPPETLFAGVVEEVARVLDVSSVAVARFEADCSSVVVASLNDPGFPVGSRWPHDGPSLNARVFETGRPARIDHYSELAGQVAAGSRASGVDSAVGAPIFVGGSAWGIITVAAKHRHEVMPAETEGRLVAFTELLATAIANSESRAALARLAEEQAALRRVATLVARGVQPVEIFSAVSEEVGRLVGSNVAAVVRFDHEAIVFVGVSTSIEGTIPIGTRWELGDALAAAAVYRTGRSARVDANDRSPVAGPLAGAGPRLCVRSTGASPIVVEGSLWGAMTVSDKEILAPDTEERLEKFTDLVATAIANAESQSELAASRRRIVAASDETRRQIERDLHDGTQQRLVSLGFALRLAQSEGPEEARMTMCDVGRELNNVVDELREISRGIHPADLSQGGLGPALKTLARRSAIPVELHGAIEHRLPEPVEVAAYYVVSEALTNATKHANASRVHVTAAVDEGSLLLAIRDNGAGGADAACGSGLIGLHDRVSALGGSIEIESLPARGTHIAVRLPLEVDRASQGAMPA